MLLSLTATLLSKLQLTNDNYGEEELSDEAQLLVIFYIFIAPVSQPWFWVKLHSTNFMTYAFYITIAPPPYSTLLKCLSSSTVGGTIKDVICYENVECVIVNEPNLSSQ